MLFAGYTNIQKIELKQRLKQVCISLIEARIDNLDDAIKSAQESANSEEKSSAGDKYETSRAMGHLAQEMLGTQLEDARNDLAVAKALNTEVLHNTVMAGSVVVCKEYTLYVSVGLGNTVIDGQKVMLLSQQAPIASVIYHKKAGELFTFNGKTVTVVDVF